MKLAVVGFSLCIPPQDRCLVVLLHFELCAAVKRINFCRRFPFLQVGMRRVYESRPFQDTAVSRRYRHAYGLAHLVQTLADFPVVHPQKIGQQDHIPLDGDGEALACVVSHYQHYIKALATRPLKDEYGNEYLCVDEDMRLRLEAKLIRSIVTSFKVLSA